MRFQSGGVARATRTMSATTASQQRPFSLMALTNRVSADTGAGSVVAGVGLGATDVALVSIGISELEIDESAAFGCEDAQVNNHEYRDRDAGCIRLENAFQARLEQKLIKPDDRHEQQHERRDLRRVPRAGADA